MAEIENTNNHEVLLEKIQSLEKRISGIESMLRIEWLKKEETRQDPIKEIIGTDATESRVVEYGLGWLGSIVLLFGIIFLMSYLDGLGHFVASKLIAYISTLSLLIFAFYFRKAFPILFNVLTISCPILLYYITVKLHFFTTQPLIASKGLAILLITMLIVLQLYIAFRRNSEFLGVIAVTFCVLTSVFANEAYITFGMLIATAAISLLLFYQKGWWKSLIYSLFLVYLAHLTWLLNNPMMGNPMKYVELPQHSILFLFGYGILYAASIFISKEKVESTGKLISITLWNALGFSFLLLLTVVAFYQDGYALICSLIAGFCLFSSVFLKLNPIRNFAPATYACFGFIALSVSIYGFFGLPNAYFLLVLQSFLVVSIALWYRSKIIVIANSLLFVSILLLYLLTSEIVDSINFAFAFTSLATARILNWKKARLTLQTEMFRNVYLLAAFYMILMSFNHALPSQYVTLAWTAVAIGFLALSIILDNIKYRYMSISTMVVTGGHLFFIDLSQMEIGYRVIAFLVFAVISIGVSLYYTKRLHNT